MFIMHTYIIIYGCTNIDKYIIQAGFTIIIAVFILLSH